MAAALAERHQFQSVSVPAFAGKLRLVLIGLTETTFGLLLAIMTAWFGYCERDRMSDCSV